MARGWRAGVRFCAALKQSELSPYHAAPYPADASDVLAGVSSGSEVKEKDYLFVILHVFMRTWMGHYATSRRVVGSRPDEMNEFFSIYLIIPPH
jgi:hypothetical protein